MHTLLSILFGLTLTALGILGLIPSLQTEGHLFRLFATNFSLSALYIASGTAVLVASGAGEEALKLFLKILSILFILFTLAGFWHLGSPVFTLFANNFARALLNGLIAAASFWLGFLYDKKL